ncbi:flagellar motor protein MotB [Stakelama tenebrarum]|uniref:Flagellar motor protein MotB n=1 Tax=Stakelama tenebrarum TaxID=2711215 RepID=A0A6G6Y1J9_9SPHN|nr:flagellar motor protein MotB [Sphingosinithalassobacter tenebrarum]QIG78711.1 flagellar motor protein MotB [Sphingosinithalassobacter tenebrarum]
MTIAATLEDTAPQGRPVWLTTLADLGLLLVGFFVFLHANQSLDGGAMAAGMREAFDGPQAHEEMPVAIAAAVGFAPGSAAPVETAPLIAWAREAARDPRTRLTVTGETDGSPADVDRETGSAAILAADRARAVAVLLVRSGAVPPERIALATGEGRRRVIATLAYAGADSGAAQPSNCTAPGNRHEAC